MKKFKGVGINSWAEMEQDFFKTNEMVKNLFNPMDSMEWATGNSVLMDSRWGQNSIADMMKGMNLKESFKSFGLVDLFQTTNAFQEMGIGSLLKDMFCDIGIGSYAGVGQILETTAMGMANNLSETTLQNSFETSAMAMVTTLSDTYTGLNQDWLGAWNRNAELIKTSGISDYINGYEKHTDVYDDEDTIKPEEIQEFQGDLSVLREADEYNWEHKFAAIFQKWADKHPVWAIILVGFIVQIFISIASNYIQFGITKTIATIRSEPSIQSETVAIFDQNQRLTVIGDDVPYYYQIEFYDPTTGNVKTGWVSKKSVMIIEEETIEEDTMTEE